MARLLPRTPIFGHRTVERRKIIRRCLGLACVARGNRGDVQRIAIARICRQQFLRNGERTRVIACLQRLARRL